MKVFSTKEKKAEANSLNYLTSSVYLASSGAQDISSSSLWWVRGCSTVKTAEHGLVHSRNAFRGHRLVWNKFLILWSKWRDSIMKKKSCHMRGNLKYFFCLSQVCFHLGNSEKIIEQNAEKQKEKETDAKIISVCGFVAVAGNNTSIT